MSLEMLDITNLNRKWPTAFVCVEGVCGSGKSTLIANLKKYSRILDRPHDLYMDRFAASLYVYGREVKECTRLEQLVKGNALYIWIEMDPLEALSRVSVSKIEVYKISQEVQLETYNRFKEYWEKHCILPVITVYGNQKVDFDTLLKNMDMCYEMGILGS